MPYDPKALAQALTAYEAQKARRGEELALRAAQVGAQVPRVAQIEARMRQSGLELARAALSSAPDEVERRVARLRAENLSLQQERAELLVRHGYAFDYLYAGPRCTVCGDTGFGREGVCDCLASLYRDEQLALLRQSVGAPLPRFADFNVDLFVLEKKEQDRAQRRAAYEGCRAFAEQFGRHEGRLCLYGEAGSGKTYLAACVAEAAIQKGFSVVYETAAILFGHYEDERFRRSEDAREELRRYASCDLLVLDDLGTEPAGNLVSPTLYQLLNQRMAAGRGLVLCAAFNNFEEISRRYSPQIASRLENDFQAHALPGGDRRKLKRRL